MTVVPECFELGGLTNNYVRATTGLVGMSVVLDVVVPRMSIMRLRFMRDLKMSIVRVLEW